MRKKILSLIIPILVALFNILIIFFPQQVIEAARQGASLWANNVLPSLLPFFIGTNLLIGLGAVDFIGVLLDPIMMPMFGVPGCGGFALTMGMTSGYPIGAKIVGNLRQSEQITKIQGQRLMSFVNNSGPLFMIGSIGIGMFNSASVGHFIIITNFSAALITGCLFKYYKYEPTVYSNKKQKHIMRKAIAAMDQARLKDSRPFGKLLADSVAKAMESILQIAGFIILFCVIIKMLETIGVISVLADILYGWGFIQNKSILTSIIYGVLEVTNGANKLSDIGLTKPVLITCAALVSFGGLSIYAQSTAFLSQTDISAVFYLFTKIINAAITIIIGLFLYPLFDFSVITSQQATPAFAVNPVNRFMVSTLLYTVTLLAILVTAFAVNIGIYFQNKKKRRRYY